MQGLIDVTDVKRRRPRSAQCESEKQETVSVTGSDRVISGNQKSFQYYIIINHERVQVCIRAFLSIFCISEKRVRRIRELKIAGKPVKDLRGKHTSFALDVDVKIKMHEHIQSFPYKISHYSGKEIKYLSPDLNTNIMYQLFKKVFPDVRLSYSTYWTYFKENFDLRFGQPVVDSCCKCEELKVKIKSPHLNESAKRAAVAELAVHVRKSKKFYSALKQDITDDKSNNILSLSVDFMQNISLPKVPVQELFYLRQLTVNVFCVHNNKTNTSVIYLYHEGQAKKGPDETSSFLFDYINNHVQNQYDELHVYSDNCPGQNKNHCMSRFLLSLTDTRKFKTIQQFFPVRGHSFLPCDRDFSTIKRALRRHDRIYSIHEITEIIIASSKNKKFTVVEVDSASLIFDFKGWWSTYYKKTAVSLETAKKGRSERIHFGISDLYHFIYNCESPGVVAAFTVINGLVRHTFLLRHSTKQSVFLPAVFAYPVGMVPLKSAKIQDIGKALIYVTEEHKDFYEEILQWPTSAEHNDTQ